MGLSWSIGGSEDGENRTGGGAANTHVPLHGQTYYGMNIWYFFFLIFPEFLSFYLGQAAPVQTAISQTRYIDEEPHNATVQQKRVTTSTSTLYVRNRVRLQRRHPGELPLPLPMYSTNQTNSQTLQPSPLEEDKNSKCSSPWSMKTSVASPSRPERGTVNAQA